MLTVSTCLLAFALALSAGVVAEQRCPKPAGVPEELARATAVFSGEAVGAGYRRVDLSAVGGVGEIEVWAVRFKVTRWWKGGGPAEAVVYTSSTRTPGVGLHSLAEGPALRKGESYLVYAYGPPHMLKAGQCSRTKPLARAAEDLRELGEGRAPEERRE